MGLRGRVVSRVFANRLWRIFRTRAEGLVRDPQRAGELIRQASAHAEKARGPLDRLRHDLRLLVGLVRDWVRGEYRKVPVGTLIVILGAILYWLDPLDAIPDVIPVLGFVDDAFVLGLVIRQVRADLERYRLWKEHPA